MVEFNRQQTFQKFPNLVGPQVSSSLLRADIYAICRHHRQVIMTKLLEMPSSEIAFLSSILAKDPKNYHVWSYRQWLVRHFSLWDTELPYIKALLEEDVRNNSAWNHRWFVVFGRHMDPEKHTIKNNDAMAKVSSDIVDREIRYAMDAISISPQNQSPWLYLRGVLRKDGRSISRLIDFATRFADLGKPDEVRSSHALEVLADVYAEERDNERAAEALELLGERYDPIRKNYWDYRKSQLGQA